MFVRKSFQFRLRPTKPQAKLLQAQLDECRWLYNELLSQRKLSHEKLNSPLSKYQQLMFLLLLKEEKTSLQTVHSQVLQNIVDQYQYICIEDLNVKRMIEGSHFAKSITDVSWNQFRQFLTYKAAEAGRKLGVVSPAYTSQIGSQCGHLEPKKLANREHKCSQGRYTARRDFNAAQNILALGLDGLGGIPRSLRF